MHETTLEAASQGQAFLAGAIFLITYALIVSERVQRTVAALLGGFAMILLHVVTQEEAFHAVDFNVIFLLAGMMMIAHILSETGFFQWIAIQAVKLGRRDPFRIMILLCLVTAVASAALDNVTVVVLIAPVTLFVAANLHISPLPFLIAEVLASNIGGAATLIGDPPNILIGSAANIDFITFAANMTPPLLVVLVLFIPLSYFVFRQELIPLEEGRPRVSSLETGEIITDQALLVKSLSVIGLVLIGFTMHGILHLEPATIAMAGATILMLISRKEPHHVLQHVEWTTLFFFVGLFITVEALVVTGIIKTIADWVLALTHKNLTLTTMIVLWLSAFASGIVDNIPYTATMIPLIKELGNAGMNTEPMWWALALGADLGGNFTLVGASANVVVASLAERSGYHISFIRFLKYSFVITLISILVSMLYLWLFHL
jgi:Na+/H+ antiporter NhaD/arsenite permease-like protein